MAISIQARKAKARKLQQYIRDMILAHFPLLPDDARSTGMGQPGVDVQLSPKARKHFNFDVECKCDENRSVWTCWKQAVDNEKKGKAILFMHKNHCDTLAVLRASDLFLMLEELDTLRFPREKLI